MKKIIQLILPTSSYTRQVGFDNYSETAEFLGNNWSITDLIFGLFNLSYYSRVELLL